ncbi:MAG: PucR family transcriptional regulator [Nocardioidaceae bacterium]
MSPHVAETENETDSKHVASAVWFDDKPLPVTVRGAADDFPVESLIELVVEQCAETAFTAHAHDEKFLARLRASVSQNAYALRDVLAGRLALDDVALDRVLFFATVQAQLRIPQKAMQRSYRVSFFIQWEMWTRHLRAWMARTDLSPTETVEALLQLTRLILSYQDYVASQVAETYTRDYEALNRSRAHVRKSLIRDVLRGEGDSLSAADLAILAYPLDAHHVAVLLPTMPEGAAAQLADGLRSATHAHQSLLCPLTLSSTAIWLCRLEPWRAPALDRISAVLDEVGAAASVSNPRVGIAGFRDALKQAEDAERVRAAWGPRNAPAVISYADAGLEILLLQDDALARDFVNAELGPLAQDSAEAARLRETLEASFRFGSHVAAAEHMQLHEHTVRNRLHKAEELLGHSLQERRTELQVAVRLVRLLADEEPG